jgi:raffinose/stachyose/melibiose transport system substrate-binding protein
MWKVAVAAASVLIAVSSNALAREPVTLWFWGAPPNLQEAFQKVLVEPFNASQDQYETADGLQ